MKKKLKEAPLGSPGGMSVGPAPKSMVGSSLSRELQNIAQDMREMEKSMIVQSPKGTYKIDKHPNGLMTLSQTRFTPIQPLKMPAPDLLSALAGISNQFNTVMKECSSPKKVVKENKLMENSNLVKKDLLRRKITEHFSANPKSTSVIISANIGESRTLWKVERVNKAYSVVEVNTKKEQFMLEAPLGAPNAVGSGMSVGGQQPASGAVPVNIDKMSTSDIMMNIQSKVVKVTPKVVAKVLAPVLVPKDANLKKQLKDTVTLLRAAGPDTPSSSFLGTMDEMMNTPEWLAAGRKRKGKRMSEAGEEQSRSEREQPTNKPETRPKKEVGPDFPVSDDEEPEEVGIEKRMDITSPDAQFEPKTGESARLKGLLQNKPIKDINVTEDGVELDLGGLKNNIKIKHHTDGKITWSLGELSHTIKASSED